MLICDRDKWVYVSVPRTASLTVRSVLAGAYPLRRRRRGEGEHGQIVPADCKNYHKWAVVRNPYARALSIWLFREARGVAFVAEHASLRGRARYVSLPTNVLAPARFEDWMVWVNEHADQFPPVACCSRYLQQAKPDTVIKTEQLAEGLRDVAPQADSKLPYRGSSAMLLPRVERIRYLTPTAVSLVKRWAQADFELYGYPKEPAGADL